MKIFVKSKCFFLGLRRAKHFPIELPDIDEDRKLQKTKDILEMRELMKRRGQLPTRPGREYPIAPTCMSDVIDRYIPQEENFGKSPLFSVKVHTHINHYNIINSY